MVATVNWDPNRYGSTKRVLSYNASTRSYSVVDQDHNYTGITYNFAKLPAAGTTTGTTTGTTSTTQTQTASAFGDVRPYYWQGEGEGGIDEGQMTTGFQEKDTAKRTLFDTAKDKFQRTFTPESYYKYKGPGDDDLGVETIYPDEDQPGFIKRTTGFITKPIKKATEIVTTPLRAKWKKYKPLALKALDYIMPEETSTQRHAKTYFDLRGDNTGRIGGNPAEDLYAGMNRVSARGNLEKSGQKRLNRREETITRKGYKAGDKFYDDTQNMKNQQKDYSRSKVTAKHKADLATGGVPPGASSGNGGTDSGKSIICTQMYQQTHLEDWKKTMQLWYIFQKKYLTIEHQEGYHFLFKPFVNGMKKSKILTAIGKYCAIARTRDIKHVMFGTPFLCLPLCFPL